MKNSAPTTTLPLTLLQKSFLFITSLLIVSLGQPARCWWCGLITAFCGYALFWRFSLAFSKKRVRFYLGLTWGSLVYAIQLLWLLDHPFLYIYIVWILLSLMWGLQFGVLNIFITLKNLSKVRTIIALSSLWTLMEWSRLFFMSGYTWNPVGLALTGLIYPMHMASLLGVFGLTFWIFFTNCLFVHAWINYKYIQKKSFYPIASAAIFALLLPYVYGYIHYSYHAKGFSEDQVKNPENYLSMVLVQPAFAPEEPIPFVDAQSAIAYVLQEWRLILKVVSQFKDKKVDLIVMPEYTVPFGTYSPLFSLESVQDLFKQFFGEESLSKLPPLEEPWAVEIKTSKGVVWLVDHAFIVQGLSTIFNSHLVAGMEDVDKISEKEFAVYSAALCFHPNRDTEDRYAKRVLVPMGEYIPFSFFRELAAYYGITGSFKQGMEAKVIHTDKTSFGCCICYEETFGDLMRENRVLGANLLVNMTNDGWYPNSLLPQQHLDHARLRTVENGVPLARACNTGITCAVDSLGRTVDSLGDGSIESQNRSDALYLQLPLYHYRTLYSYYGDFPLIAFCLLSVSLWGLFQFKKFR